MHNNNIYIKTNKSISVWLSVIFVLAFYPVAVMALTPVRTNMSTGTIEMDEIYVMDTALKNTRELKISEENLSAAYGRLFEGFSGFLPKINLGLSYTQLSAPQIKVSGPAAALFSSGNVSPALISDKIFGAQVSVQQPIFMWGKVYYGNKQARLNYEIASQKYRQTRNEVLYKAKENFYRARLAQKMLNIARASLELSKTYYETTQKLYQEGKSSSYDVSRAKVSLTNAQLGVLKSENGRKLALEALKTFLAMNPDEDIQIKGEFEYTPQDFELDELLSRALKNRPEIMIARFQKELAASGVRFYQADNKPQIIGSYNYTAQAADINSPFEEWDKRWQAVAAVQWSLFDGLATYGRIRQAKANLALAGESAEAIAEGIKLEVRSAYFNFIQAKEAIEVQKENVQTAQSNLEIAQQRYSLGLMSYLELQDVHLALAQAEINYQQSLFDYNLALASIKKVTGE